MKFMSIRIHSKTQSGFLQIHNHYKSICSTDYYNFSFSFINSTNNATDSNARIKSALNDLKIALFSSSLKCIIDLITMQMDVEYLPNKLNVYIVT